MPLFVTVAPGIQISDNVKVDAALLNLIAQPSVSVVGSIDSGSLILSKSSIVTTDIIDTNITLPKIATINANSVIGRGTGGITNAFLAASSGIYTDVSNIYWKPNIVQIKADQITHTSGSNISYSEYPLIELYSSITTIRNNSKILINANFDFYTSYDGCSIVLKRTFNNNTTEIGSSGNDSKFLRSGILAVSKGSTNLAIEYIDNASDLGKYTYSWFLRTGYADTVLELKYAVGVFAEPDSIYPYNSHFINFSLPAITLEELPV